MKIRHITASVLLSTMGALPLAYGAPSAPSGINGTQVTQFRSGFDNASGGNTIGNISTSFSAQTFDDLSGVKQGSVFLSFIDLTTFQQSYIQCSGPEYANSTSVNPGNGNAVVTATLDPSAPGCFGNVSAAITINVSGQLSGTFRSSSSGVNMYQFGGETFKQNFRSDQYSETYNGTVGSVSGPFDGFAQAYRSNNRQRVK